MQETFRRLLHEYRVESFKAAHSPEQAKERTREALRLCREALHQVYRFHFHGVPDAQRAEFLNLVHDYAVEALLPPIVERIIERELVLERKHELAMRLVERLLETLSSGGAPTEKAASAAANGSSH
ncbi:MAG TPA: hypothetical protein VKE69_10170 [Planctomycetota bacterium]|nr:hypothetical protein [Planctomycetota bacterium]